ncbi:MAG TPA: Spy/CpxP family protein refolding chaperone [Anaeromyxobacteraceae bacterium]
MKKTLVTALTLVAIGVGGLTLTAFRHNRDPAQLDQMVERRLTKMLDTVQATDAQRLQITSIKDKVLADGKALRATHQSTRQQLLALWKSDQPDAAQVHALVDTRVDGMKTFADEVADAMLQVHAILTPAQRATIADQIQQHMQHVPQQ